MWDCSWEQVTVEDREGRRIKKQRAEPQREVQSGSGVEEFCLFQSYFTP